MNYELWINLAIKNCTKHGIFHVLELLNEVTGIYNCCPKANDCVGGFFKDITKLEWSSCSGQKITT